MIPSGCVSPFYFLSCSLNMPPSIPSKKSAKLQPNLLMMYNSTITMMIVINIPMLATITVWSNPTNAERIVPSEVTSLVILVTSVFDIPRAVLTLARAPRARIAAFCLMLVINFVVVFTASERKMERIVYKCYYYEK